MDTNLSNNKEEEEPAFPKERHQTRVKEAHLVLEIIMSNRDGIGRK